VRRNGGKRHTGTEARVPRHTIPVKGRKPVISKWFRYDPTKEQKLEALCDNLLNAGIITESSSLWNSPVFLTTKRKRWEQSFLSVFPSCKCKDQTAVLRSPQFGRDIRPGGRGKTHHFQCPRLARRILLYPDGRGQPTLVGIFHKKTGIFNSLDSTWGTSTPVHFSLMSKDAILKWTDRQEASFCDIREALCSPPVLGYPDRNKAKANRHPVKAKIQSRDVPPEIFQRVHMDHVKIAVKKCHTPIYTRTCTY